MPLLFVLHPHRWGWRWGIYRATVDQFRANPLARCVNAGFRLTQPDADDEGQKCLYTLLAFAEQLHLQVTTISLTLDRDPLPVVELVARQAASNIVQIGD